MKIKTLFILLITFSIVQQGYAQKNNKVENVVLQLSINEKIDLLCAKFPGVQKQGLVKYDWWSECLHGVARAGKATVFPKPIAMGATWDSDLIKRIADAISDEARAKHQREVEQNGFSDRHFGLTFFSPTLNIARDPRWGRTSECFSEDPLLTSDMGVAFIKGMQGDDPYYLKTVATAKHFVANNEEDRRLGGSAEVDEMSLREYYFPAFQAAVTQGRVTSIMGAYNALNGIPCCANSFLLNDVLRNEWGFDGVVISDGSAIDKLYTHHKYVPSLENGAAMALKAGCDMSLRDEYRKGLYLAYQQGMISEEDLNCAVRRVLNLRARLGLDEGTSRGNPYTAVPYSVVESKAHQALALEAAQKSMVLLKNEGILPLELKDKTIKIGLIGEAFKTVYYGDYSGMPENNVTLFDCLTREVGKYAQLSWIKERSKEELIPYNYLKRSDDQAYDGILGFSGEYYESDKLQGDVILSRQDLMLDFTPITDTQLRPYKQLSARWTSQLKVPQSGRYILSLMASGNTRMYINGKKVAQKSNSQKVQASFEILLEQSKEYNIKIECEGVNVKSPVRLTWTPPFSEDEDTPAKLASRSDVVVLFIRDDNSSEGRDRKNLNLGDAQIELIKQVTTANPNTILLLGSGSVLALDKIVKLPKALLNVWIGGQGESQAICDLLLGRVNPSGKTAVTFFTDETQLPPIDDYNVKNGRSYQYFKGDILFPFGYGLSYTDYLYGTPKMKKNKIKDGEPIIVTTEITNTGERDGEEIVQCYLSSPDWEKHGLKQKLVGYKRIFLKSGETKRVEFRLTKEKLLRWDMKSNRWGVSTHQYEVSIAPHSGIRNLVSFTYN